MTAAQHHLIPPFSPPDTAQCETLVCVQQDYRLAAANGPFNISSMVRHEFGIEAEEKIAQAEAEAEALIESKKREISALATAARREGERIVSEATTEVTGYRQWLSGVISEAERLYRIQKQSLDAAESAIQQSRNSLDGAFQRLEDLQKSVLDNLNADDTLINPGPLKVASQRTRPALTAPKKTAKKAAKKAPAKKSAAKKSAKR